MYLASVGMLSTVWSKARCSWRLLACCLPCGVKQGVVGECWHVVYCVEESKV